MVNHGQEHNAQAAEQPKVQLTALQHPQEVASEPSPQSLESAQPPQPVPALQPFKAPTVAMLRAMRNSSIAASTAAVTVTCMPATATSTDAKGLPAGAASCTPALPPGAQLNEVSSSASSSALCNREQEFLMPLGEPQMHTVGVAPGVPVAPVVAGLRLDSTPVPADSPAPYDDYRQLPGQKLARCIQVASSGFGECIARSSEVRDGVTDATSGPSNQVSVSAGTDPAAGAVAPREAGQLEHPSVGAAAEGLPSLLSADPEELAAAIAAAVAAVAAATRTTTEAAGQSAQTDQQPSQPQLQVAQQTIQQPFAQQVLLPAANVGSDPQLQQQLSQYPQQQLLPQHHQQPLVYTAMSNYDPTSQLQIQQQHQQQPQSQQPQQLQVQFVPAGNGSGVLQVVAYGGNNGGAVLPIVSEGLPPAAAALLGAGLQPPAAVAIGGQMHVPVQQLQYGEVVQVAWSGSSGPVPDTVVYSQPGGFQQQQPQYQQQQELGTQPQVQDAYAHQVHDERYQYGAGNRQQQQLQQPYTLYDYDNQNPFQPPPLQLQQQPAQQTHYGSGPGAYDSRHEAPRHPTPYIYRPPVANTAADSCRDSQPPDPRTAWPSTDPRPGYVPLRHKAPSASFADGWHSTGRRTSHRQHPQHLLWSPPPSMLYTPTREYEEKSETPPPEVTGGSEEEPAAGTVAAGGLATASAGGEVLEAGNGKTKSAEMEVNGVTGAERISSPAADEGSLTLAAAQQRGPCSATVAAIQLIEARRKQAQAKEQEAKEQKAKERKAKEQQEKEQQQHTAEQLNKNQQVKLPKVKDLQIKEVQAKGQQQPEPNTEQELVPAYPDTEERLQESRDEAPEQVTDEQPAVATADTEAAPQPLQRPGPVTSGRGSVQPPAVTGQVTAANALEPKPLGRNKEQARAEQDAATQAMLEKARRLRQQQLQERILQERQRKEQEELRKQNKEQEEERLRERLRERLSQQQRAKAGGGAIGPAGPPVVAKPQGNVAAALAARLAVAGRDAVGGAAAVAAAAGALGGVCGATAAATAQSGGAAGQETRFQAELQELEADLESLEQQIASAPTCGMNARALVLRAAELVARRDAARASAATGAAATAALKPAPATAPADAGPGLISVVKPLADAVPLPERAFVTYVPRSSIPRLVRQEAAHSLTGGYLALALQRARVPEARAVQAVTNEPELRKAAVAAAGQHEMALYRQVTSKMNYELLFRKTKAEPERLQLQEDVVQLLNKRYGSCAKGKSPAGGAAAPTALAAPKAAAGADAARSVAAVSAGTAGGGDGRLVMPGTKRRLVPPDDVSPPSALAAAAPGNSKRVASAGAVGAAAPAGGTGARKVAPAGGLVKVKHAVGRREDDTSDRAISGTRATANVVVDELFVDSSSGDEDISGSRTVGSNEADTRAAARAVVKDVKGTLCTGAASEAKTGDVEAGPADSGAAANPSGSAMGATDRGVGGGNSNPVLAVGGDYGAIDEDPPDAPYEDLFGSDIDSGQECGTQMDVHTAKPAEGPAQTPVADAQRLQGVHAAASAITVVCRSSGPAVGSAPTSRQAHGPKAGAAADVTLGPAAAAEDGSFAPPAAVQGIDASAGCPTHVRNRKRQRVGEIGGTVGECDVRQGGRTEGSGLDKEPSRRSHVREKRRRSRSRSRSEGRPHNGDAARDLELKVSGGGGRQGSLPLQGRGHGKVLCGDDGRQGAQCEGQPPHEHQQQPVAATGSLSRAGMSQEEWEQTEVRQKLRQQVLAFIHATLEPLYRAGLLGKESYKRAAAKTCERLLSAHPDDIAPDFLVREHAQVSKFIMKVVEREQQRDAEQQPQHQEQKQQQAK
ncbi:hypothetical protein Vretifemale_5049 [Volvox reticuliferus]|nr:hypothetical protein Vretifemale_5049 [Volvox reticuliferus]